MSVEVLIIFTAIASASISFELVYSPLKAILWFDKPYPLIELISSWKFYKKLLGTISYILIPIIVPFMLLFKAHILVRTILDCIYCTAFHLSIIFCLLIGMSLPLAILTGGLSIFAQTLNNFIKTRSL